MLDIILLQDIDTGVNLLEYRQEKTQMRSEHSDIFSGFMSAIQNISQELNIGTVVLISTEGSKGHNCIVIHKPPINVIMLVDRDDPIDVWREQGGLIAERFIERYGTSFDPSIITEFKDFKETIKELCLENEYCE
jgi:hypothetical protein